ncbi:PREDICTED: TLD domain-containing protein 1 isoform X2 [Nelumbo nucifera]|uniref:TLD domain-containing protein 1 isoform X2 n=1 Tax=Nelumbo nucifera TaxID=4432 RepID=A0A1U8AK46_NELNU|nr:PREDICTED: TLD domain-containing protein 1 isoform X2 [Nelumbo nucifera]
MGNAQSPSIDPRFTSATRSFTQNELENLKSLFVSLAAQSQSNCKFISPSVFKRMFDLVTQKRNDQELTFEDLVITKGIYEKGSRDEIEEFIYQLLDVTGDGVWGRFDLEAVLIAAFDAIFPSKNAETGLSSQQYIIRVFLNTAKFSKQVEGSAENSMSFEDFKSWCSFIPSVRKFLGNLLMPPDPGRLGFQVPSLLHSESVDSNLLILRKEYAWHIGGALAQNELEEWKLLYHSSIDGFSFYTFLGKISIGEGSTVLIIKDKEGYIYGGYASQPWERHGDFYGDMKSFIFQLYPQASIFRPTGANGNLQWCAVNFSSESIPNGLGFGGRVNHFGLFLSASFDQGHTFTCSTFGSPCLSKSNQVYPEVIECWGVVIKGVQEEKSDIKGTVLERFKEDRHMLNLVGLANSSE